MRTRRSILSGAAALMGTGVVKSEASTSTNATAHDAAKFPEYPRDDVRRYGLMPNNAAAADANTAALKSLVSPTGRFAGNISFPNTTGRGIYYFNDIVPVHDGIQVEREGCTLLS